MAHFGISVALLTPYHADGSLDLPLYATHANAVLRDGANGVTLFGTTGEGASVGTDDRAAAIKALRDSGISADKMVLGLCGTALADVAAQVQQGLDQGITSFLLPPPFYFKSPNDAGLFDWHAQLFAATDPQARFILYHIPQVTAVPLSFDLVMRLRDSFSDRVQAIKDSSGNWPNTQRLLKSDNIPVLVGDERLLHKAVGLGAAGSICGMANLYPQRMRRLFDSGTEDGPLSAEVDLIVSVPVIPAIKLILSQRTGTASWENLRPPLQALEGTARKTILGLCKSKGAA